MRAVLMAALLVLAASCRKELDTPPERTLPVGQVLTVGELRALFNGNAKRFGGDSSVYAVVTADERNGNLYKNVHVQDHTGAIQLRLVNPGGLYQGDSVRIYLPGTILSTYNGMMQLDSVDVDNNVVKQATLVAKEPEPVGIAQITPAMQGRLVRVEGVEFPVSELGETWADAAGQRTINRTLTDCNGTILVRTSGFANFAGRVLPSGKGSLVAVVGQFNNDMQLFVRNINEVRMDDTDGRCAPLPRPCDAVANVSQNFGTVSPNVDISIECWNNQPQAGNRYWRGTSSNGELCAQATAFTSTNPADVTWLISPPIVHAPGMGLSFRSQRGFGIAGHDPFGLFISTDYTTGNPATATWTQLPCAYATPSTADQVWVPSGAIDIGAALPGGYSGSFVIGFRYTGSGPNGQTTNFRIDDVVVQ